MLQGADTRPLELRRLRPLHAADVRPRLRHGRSRLGHGRPRLGHLRAGMRRGPGHGGTVMPATRMPAAAGAAHGGSAMGRGSQQGRHQQASGRSERAHQVSSAEGMKGDHLAAAGAGGLRATTSLKSGSGAPPTIRSVLSTTK